MPAINLGGGARIFVVNPSPVIKTRDIRASGNASISTGIPGEPGPQGIQGPPGPPGASQYDMLDLTLVYENGLI